MIKILLKKVLHYIAKNKYYYILVIIFRFLIMERLPNGKNKIIYSSSDNRTTILALDSDNYRGDLEVLASNSSLRVLCIKNKWQGALIDLLYNKDEIDILEYSRALPGDDIYNRIKQPAQEFMCEFLKKLFSIIKVDCVTTVNYRYIYDIDWTLASEKIGIPYIMLYRECLLQKEHRFYHDVVRRHRLFKFHGSHIIVHNDTCKESFVESSFCDEQKISVVGALRMDKYLTSLKSSYRYIKNKRKRFILFYFPYNMSLFGKSGEPPLDYKYKYAFSIWPERKNYFRDIHSAIAELAIERPDIDFVIKPKNIMMKNASWKYYERVLNEIGFDTNKVDNYSVEPNADVHELILNSDVFCALQSSTVIESSISGKPVIVPVFENYKSTKNYKDFIWRERLELFSVADNKQHLKELIIDLMDHPYVDNNILDRRKKVFKSFFNDLDGVSLNYYVNIITNVAIDGKNIKHNVN
jgi:hypothetical protein